jgi:hypothetical protein
MVNKVAPTAEAVEAKWIARIQISRSAKPVSRGRYQSVSGRRET